MENKTEVGSKATKLKRKKRMGRKRTPRKGFLAHSFLRHQRLAARGALTVKARGFASFAMAPGPSVATNVMNAGVRGVVHPVMELGASDHFKLKNRYRGIAE
jgi:hypothetical protein